MAESFEKIRIIFYVTGQKIRYKKPCRGIEQVREARRKNIKPFLLESSLSVQSSKTKTRTKLVLVIREPLNISNLTNPINKMFLRLIYFKKIQLFPVSKQLLTRRLITTLPSDVTNVPVRFRAQQHVSIANHSSRSTVSQLKCVSNTISN